MAVRMLRQLFDKPQKSENSSSPPSNNKSNNNQSKTVTPHASTPIVTPNKHSTTLITPTNSPPDTSTNHATSPPKSTSTSPFFRRRAFSKEEKNAPTLSPSSSKPDLTVPPVPSEQPSNVSQRTPSPSIQSSPVQVPSETANTQVATDTSLNTASTQPVLANTTVSTVESDTNVPLSSTQDEPLSTSVQSAEPIGQQSQQRPASFVVPNFVLAVNSTDAPVSETSVSESVEEAAKNQPIPVPQKLSVSISAQQPARSSAVGGFNFLDKINANVNSPRVSNTGNFLEVLQQGGDNRDQLVKRLSKRLSFVQRRSSSDFDHTIFPPLISSTYRILEKLGTGGFADVFKVENRHDKTFWAMKVIYKNRVKDQRRLDQEIEALTRAQHPCIVCLRETLSNEQHLYLRQDLAVGGCLFDLLVDMGGFGEVNSAIVMKKIFEAVEYLHSIGIVHRDIKLENILLGRHKDVNSVKLSDFGVAHIFQEVDADPTSPSMRGRYRANIISHVGSVAYMAPEIFLGKRYNQAVDLWACGVMLYMLLSLASPFGNDEDDPGAEQDQIARIVKADFDFKDALWARRSEDSKDLVSRLLRLNPEERLTATEALQHPWIVERTSKN